MPTKAGRKAAVGWEILKSECLAYYARETENRAVNADGHQQKGNNRWPSNNITEIGTVIMVQHYAHLSPTHLTEHARKIDEVLAGNITNLALLGNLAVGE